MSEMSYAKNLIKGNVVERTHLRQAVNEDCFGMFAISDMQPMLLRMPSCVSRLK